MKKLIRAFARLLMVALPLAAATAQTPTQVIRGIVVDRISEKPLAGAIAKIPGTTLGGIADEQGRFVVEGVPTGRIMLLVRSLGYKPATIAELLVTAGKEVVLEIALEEEIASLNEVVVKGRARKGIEANEFAQASTRSFVPEEVQRFAGGRNDPSKLVSNYGGVISGNDARNDIVVRGNSPTGVLWRIEGLPAPNPNHFGTLGTSGGPVTILNTNALKGANFLTGAFPAEFGNATAAVFDIQLRSGNSSRHERTLQLNAFSGVEAMLEGPLGGKRTGASYLAGYRYSFAQIAQSIGLNVGTDAVPRYQDWVYHLDFGKGRRSQFSLYGMGGVSSIDFIGKDLDTTDFYARQDQDANVRTHMMLMGGKHTLQLSDKSFLRTTISYTRTRDHFDQYQYPMPVPPYADRWQVQRSRNDVEAIRWHSYINVKQSAKMSWRAGLQSELSRLQSDLRDREGKPASAPFEQLRQFDDRFNLWQAYAQSRYKPAEKWTMVAGVNLMYLTLNGSTLLTPRFSVNYMAGPSGNLYLSYGQHGQMQPLPVYLLEKAGPDGKPDRSNRELDFTKAHHLVLGYDRKLGNHWQAKLETYWQRLYDVPVDSAPSGYSVLNEGSDFTFQNRAGLVNGGTGINYGVELTLERLLHKGWYLLATTSLFDSRYKGSDKVERNTSFNYGYVGNLLGGAEWKTGKKGRNALTFDMRVSAIGGRYQTPVDLAASMLAGREIPDESRYNAEQLDAYVRLDVKFGYRINSRRSRMSQTLYLDLQNLTNRQNIFLQRYNALRGTVGNVYQLGFFPDIMYKLQF